MNERSEQFKRFVAERMQTRAYKRTARWIGIRIWVYRLFHRKKEATDA